MHSYSLSALLIVLLGGKYSLAQLTTSTQQETCLNQATRSELVSNQVWLQQYVLNDTVTLQMTYEGQAWLGLGFSDNGGRMVGSSAVIGEPSTGAVHYWYMGGESVGALELLSDSNLLSSTIQQDTTQTVLTFTMPLNGKQVGQAYTCIMGVGYDNTLGVHAMEGSFDLTLSACDVAGTNSTSSSNNTNTTTTNTNTGGGSPISTNQGNGDGDGEGDGDSEDNGNDNDESESDDGYGDSQTGTSSSSSSEVSGLDVSSSDDSESKRWLAHGILMGIAWAILVPLAVGCSVLRDALPLPQGMWFKLHMWFNTLAIVCTIVGFALAMSTIKKAEGTQEALNFNDDKHRSLGLAVFVLAVFQGIVAYFRPHAPSAPSTVHAKMQEKTEKFTDDDEEENGGLPATHVSTDHETKTTLRFLWEIKHRLLAVAIVGMAWYCLYTGLDLYEEEWGEASKAARLQKILWAVVGSLSGVILLGFVAMKLVRRK